MSEQQTTANQQETGESQEKKKEEKKFGILTDKELIALGIIKGDKDGNTDIFPDCYSNASFDFTLGNEYFFPKQYHDALRRLADDQQLDSPDELPDGVKKQTFETLIRRCEDSGDMLIIPKFSSVVISTYEQVNLPDNVAGRFDLRIKWALAGLVLQVGTQIEPGYRGRLWGLLHNFSGEAIRIPYHQMENRLLTAEFSFTYQKAPVKDRKKTNQPINLKTLLEKYPVRGGSLQNYFDEIESIEKKIEKKVEEELEKINKSREEFRQAYTTRIEGQLALVQALQTKVDATLGEVNKLNNKVNDAAEKVYNRRMNFMNVGVVIIAFAVSIGVPFWATQFANTNYQMYEDAKALKNNKEVVSTSIDSLKRVNRQLADSVYTLRSEQNRIKKEIENIKKKLR
jgi:deoxycytidine triphosphate deaminase